MGNVISKRIKAIFKKRIKTIINNEHYYITGVPLSCNYNFVIRDVEVTNCFTNENFILHRKDKVQFIKTKKIDGLELMEFIFNEKKFHLTSDEVYKYLLILNKNKYLFEIKYYCEKINKLGFITLDIENHETFFKFSKFEERYFGHIKKSIVKYIFEEIFLYVKDIWIWADKAVLNFYYKNIINNLYEMEEFLYKNKNKTFQFEIVKKYAQLIQEIHSLIFEYGETMKQVETANEKYLNYKEKEKRHYLYVLENLNAKLDVLTEYKNC